jgi:thiol-disulfide isomerase/thioredoxin
MNDSGDDRLSRPARRSLPLLVTAAALAAGFAAVYLTLGRADNVNGAAEAPAATGLTTAPGAAEPAGPGRNPLSTGHMAAFVFKKEREPLPATASFMDGTGKQRSIADWSGKVVLLNLWATWCAPCRKEMPALDRLQKAMGSDTFEVVAVSVDRAGRAAAEKFLSETKVEGLGLYVDPSARFGAALQAVGMPTTLLVDPKGREIGRLIGPAEWDSEDARRLIAWAQQSASPKR